jgi:hypothetical protein
MRGIFLIRIKALLLSVIFTGNFLIVCHCSASATAPGMAMTRQHCCCPQKTRPCKGDSDCAGNRAVKFNLVEKKAPASVQLGAPDFIPVSRDFWCPVAGRQGEKRSDFFPPPSLHSPPDRLAFYHCYLI